MLYTLGKELDHTLKKTLKNMYKFTCNVEVVEVYVCVCVCRHAFTYITHEYTPKYLLPYEYVCIYSHRYVYY